MIAWRLHEGGMDYQGSHDNFWRWWKCFFFSFPLAVVFTGVYVCAQSLSCVWLFVILWTVAHQAPFSMRFSRQEYWSGLSCPPPEDLLDPEIKPKFPATPALQADSLPLGHLGRLIQPLIVWFWASNSPFLIFSFLFYKPSTIIIINLMSLI